MVRTRLAVLLVAPMMLLAACGGNDDSSGLPTATESTQSSTPPQTSSTPSTTPTPSSAPTRAVAKYHDLTVDLRRPAKVAAAAEPAVGKFLELSKFFGQMASGDKTPASLAGIADPPAIKYLDSVLQAQRAKQERSGGTMMVRVEKAQAQSRLAVVDACMDQKQLVTIRPNGTRYVDATVKRSPTLALRATVSGTTGQWRITEFFLKETKC